MIADPDYTLLSKPSLVSGGKAADMFTKPIPLSPDATI